MAKEKPIIKVKGHGVKSSGVMFVIESNGPLKGYKHRALDTYAAQLMVDIMEDCNLDWQDVYITSLIRTNNNEQGKPMTKAQLAHCKEPLQEKINKIKPQVVLLIGNGPLQAVMGCAGIAKLRGKVHERDNVVYLPTLAPGVLINDKDRKKQWLMKKDIKLFTTLVEHGGIPKEKDLNSILVDSPTKLKKMYRALKGDISFDIETNGLYAWKRGAKITAIGFGTKKYQFTLLCDHEYSNWTPDELADIMEELTDILEERKVNLIAHNGKFDYLWMRVHYGVIWKHGFDTQLAHYLLDENSPHGLKLLAQKILGAFDYDIDLETKQGNQSLEKFVEYHAKDLLYTYQLKPIFEEQLREDPPVNKVFKHIMMPASELYCDMEFNGVQVNVKKMGIAEKYLKDRLNAANDNLLQWGDINWGSPKQLGKLMFEDLGIPVVDKTPSGAYSTSESTLNQIDHDMVSDLLKWRGAQKQLSAFIEGWKPYLVNERLHPSFKLFGTVTGRPSCEHPNLQQVPRDTRIRSLICARPGWTLIEADLSQVELRIAAEMSGDRQMTYAFFHGIDIHWLTAIREIARAGASAKLVKSTAKKYLNKKKITYSEAIEALLKMGPKEAIELNKDWKEARKKAKAINFGFLYGMWWKKFKIYARDNYGVEITDEQSQASREAFFELYSDLPAWHKRQKEFARRNGYVRSLTGRKRRLPEALRSNARDPKRMEAERQAVNAPVQSFGSDLNIMAAIELWGILPPQHVKLCGTIHDAIIFEIRDAYVEKTFKTILKVMGNPKLLKTFDIDFSIPIIADGEIGPWSEGVDLETWKKEAA